MGDDLEENRPVRKCKKRSNSSFRGSRERISKAEGKKSKPNEKAPAGPGGRKSGNSEKSKESDRVPKKDDFNLKNSVSDGLSKTKGACANLMQRILLF